MAIRINRVYTRTGDKGETHLVGGKRVPKDDPRIESYGTIDELNSVLGIVRACNDAGPPSPAQTRLDQILRQVQNELFDLGSELATPPDAAWEGMIRIGPEQIAVLERTIDECQEELAPLQSFILPGGGMIAAFLHQARTVCRRAGRRVGPRLRQSALGSLVRPVAVDLAPARRAGVPLGKRAHPPRRPPAQSARQGHGPGAENEMTDAAPRVYVRQLEIGPMQNYVYLVGDPE